jgi:hypothetical protein
MLAACHNRQHLPQQQPRRQIFDFAASYPDETVVAFGTAIALASYRIWTLELRTREQEHSLQSQQSAMKVREQLYDKNERELQNANKTLLQKYNTMRDLKQRMEDSIIERGKAGEEVLGNVLSECKVQSIIKDFKLQHEIAPGKRPDAVVEITDGIFIVVDCKAPFPPYDLNEQSRREYADKLKVHIRQLGDKRYNSTLEQKCLMVTLMMLPGEGYLQAAYDQGRDIFELYKFARDRNVLLLGPNGLRSLLQVVKISLEEQVAHDRLRDGQVHENIATTLQPLWVDSLLPCMRRVGTLLESITTTWNSNVDSIVAFDKALRSKDILDLSKARKTELPKKVTLPKPIGEE